LRIEAEIWYNKF